VKIKKTALTLPARLTHSLSMALTAPKFHRPRPCNLPKSEIESIATSVARMLRFKIGDDVAEVVSKLGGTLFYLRRDEWLEHDTDTIVIRGPRDFDIRLLGSAGPLRQNFTIAHELGHYILHSRSGKVAPMVAGRKGSTRVEWEANWFAASLLMPEKEFKMWALKPEVRDLTLSGVFGVSLEAVQVRKQALDISA
jgi:hypothetical protein